MESKLVVSCYLAQTMDYLNYNNGIQAQSGVSRLVYSGTSASEQFTGTSLNETFVGNLGNDTLIGGAGDDVYVVQNTTTQVIEQAGGGTDTVKVTVNYILPDNVENLVMMGDAPKGGLTGVGNALNNLILGSTVNQTMIGMGGNDVLVGGGGSDTYVFSTGSGHDVITDFMAGTGAGSDIVRLQNYGMTTFSQVKAAMTQVGADVVLKLSATDDVTFRNTTVETFTGDNFKLPIDLNKYTLTFSDDFNTLSLQTLGKASTGTWATEFGFGGYGPGKGSHFIGNYTGESQIYVDATYAGSGTTPLGINPFSITDGVLTITATANSDVQKAALWGIGFSSGLLTTKTSFQQTYGYFEMRAQMPTGQGAWPAFWLASSTTTSELDILEVVSENPNFINMTVHDKSYASGSVGSGAYAPGAATGFHTYGLLWTAATLTYYIDGVPVYAVPTPDNMHGPMYLLLNQATDGWAVAPNPASMPTGFQVDYVHAYSLDTPQARNLTGTAGADKLDGAAGDDTLDGGAGGDTMTGSLGNDVYVVDHANDVVVEVADQGLDTVRTNLAIYTLGANVENLVYSGTGSFKGIGNELANQITGGDGGDLLDGGTGADTLTGGAGDDTYIVDHVGDLVIEAADAGTDLIKTSLSTYGLTDNIENLTYTGIGNFAGAGNALANVITGGASADTLDGGSGDDTVIGGGGDDSLLGGVGTDVAAYAGPAARYLVTPDGSGGFYVQDTLVGAENEGKDHLLGVEWLQFADSLVDLSSLIASKALAGTASADALFGGFGNDTLDGGVGADTMTGSYGDDTYIIDHLGDVVVEAAGQGVDTVRTNLTSYTLGANVENLTYTGTGMLKAVGNDLANQITGGSGNDVLDGGRGADTLIGGAGNDTYIVDHVGDLVVEAANAGSDLVKTTLSAYALTDNVETLTYTGAGSFFGSGNALANVITGGVGNDTLDGGIGGDRLVGGLGDDTYYVDSASDTITENIGEGYDTQVTTLVSAKAAVNVEALIYGGVLNFTGYANATGTAMTGGGGADTLSGAAGDDVLNGGAGNDYLSGGAGADVFRFDGLGLGIDKIADFQVGVDHIALKATGFGVTSLDDLDFVSGVGPSPTSGHATLLYDTTTGGLFFDANGGDGADKVQIATLANKAAIHLSDFWLA
ncbi:hypothetical protein BH10PSE4_BH10PSE4_07270 [soil metagenome]